jgi:hypothetical protein
MAGAEARPTEEKKAGINPVPTHYERNRQREMLQREGKEKSPSIPTFDELRSSRFIKGGRDGGRGGPPYGRKEGG